MVDPSSPPAPLDAPSHGTRRARWGMLAITLVMGVTLVATGVATWVGARDAADSIGEARAFDLLRAARRPIRDAVEDFTGTLDEVLDEFREDGLRAIAVYRPDGTPLGTAGEARDPGGIGVADLGRAPRITPEGDLLRVEALLATRPRRGPRGGFHGGAGRPGRAGPRALAVVLEIEPVMANALSASARNQLAVTSVTAVLLLVLALVFWRLGARADRFEAQLARDRRLAALGEMSAVLGHELRNPLASLKGHAQLVLERTPDDARAFKNAERVVREAERLETLTRQILDFARTGQVERRPCAPAEILRRAVDAVGDGRVVVDVDGAPEAWDLDGDRVEQVLVNLLKNATQASPEGAAVDARCARDGGRLVYEVRDRGQGFPPGEAEVLFEPFHTRKVQGTGLGLAIARRIVDAHGGHIEARNASDGGAVVRVTVPAAPA